MRFSNFFLWLQSAKSFHNDAAKIGISCPYLQISGGICTGKMASFCQPAFEGLYQILARNGVDVLDAAGVILVAPDIAAAFVVLSQVLIASICPELKGLRFMPSG